MSPHRLAAALLGLLLVAGCSASGGTASGRPAAAGYRFHGLVPDRPAIRPQFTLTDTGGASYDFGRRTAGRATLLYFGYTNCPDQCPTAMADIAAGLRKVGSPLRERVDVVFVTTDPARDTAGVLRTWLDLFDPGFVGLTGTQAQVEAAQDAAGVPRARRQPLPSAGGSPPVPQGSAAGPSPYAVDHAAPVIAIGADNRIAVLYLAGTVSGDYVADLPELAKETS
ncbi:MAG: SCO family protein [Mycobacteriales bacterium]